MEVRNNIMIVSIILLLDGVPFASKSTGSLVIEKIARYARHPDIGLERECHRRNR